MGESFAQSRQQLVDRDCHQGKQRVSPFYHVSQLLQEKNVFRSPESGMLLFESKERVFPFNHPSFHQICTLEKTKLCHRPILSSLLSACFQRIGTTRLYVLSSFSVFALQGSDFQRFSYPGFLTPKMTELRDPLQSNSSLVFKFAVTLSSPDSSGVLFKLTSKQSTERKCLM